MLDQLLYSLKLGDGCIQYAGKNAYLSTCSISEDYLQFKKDRLEQLGCKVKYMQGPSGYVKNKIIKKIFTRIHPDITELYNTSISDCIKSLDKEGLIMLYLDDGSLHKHKLWANIYCNTFTKEECELLIQKIWDFYPGNRCTILYDRKQDGRCFPYVSIHISTMRMFLKDIQQFVINNHITSLYYKANLPSETIPKGSTAK